MPTHVYQPTLNPPSWRDRLLVHPLDSTVALVAILFAVLVCLSLLLPEFIPSKSMDRMPWWIVVAVSGFLGTGGLLAIIGLNWQGDSVSKGWALERLGWALAAGGFATYAITVCSHYPASVFSWAIPLSLSFGAALRFWSVALIEKGMRHSIAEVKGGTHE